MPIFVTVKTFTSKKEVHFYAKSFSCFYPQTTAKNEMTETKEKNRDKAKGQTFAYIRLKSLESMQMEIGSFNMLMALVIKMTKEMMLKMMKEMVMMKL